MLIIQNLILIYLKFKFNWSFYILSGNSNWMITDQKILRTTVPVLQIIGNPRLSATKGCKNVGVEQAALSKGVLVVMKHMIWPVKPATSCMHHQQEHRTTLSSICQVTCTWLPSTEPGDQKFGMVKRKQTCSTKSSWTHSHPQPLSQAIKMLTIVSQIGKKKSPGHTKLQLEQGRTWIMKRNT